MEFAADLHIHSALSPCASNDMTPNNIINMAVLKGLDVIAVSDHNSAYNLPALYKLSLGKDIMLLPGIEVQTKEEIHMLCYFKTVEDALAVGDMLYDRLPDIKNDEELFGQQLVMDENDNIVKHVEKLLLSSADISAEDLVGMASSMDAVCVPAHVDRNSYSIVYNLGFIPENLNISSIEVSRNASESDLQTICPGDRKYNIIRNSDAHYLQDILERESFIDIPDLTLINILKYLNC